MVLPTCLGGLGIINPVKHTTIQYSTSHAGTAPLVNLVIEQPKDFTREALEKQIHARNTAYQAKRQTHISVAHDLLEIPNSLQRAVEISREKGLPAGLLLYQFQNMALPPP